ncbi:MAG: ABC transporter substrate-binding protein [Clostridiales bacterium]|jgi:peptide/nickel transport system substrate-binding protein|nr:ABC transporter substrate-binding protein [Clostridiales bacterium]
MPRALLVLPVVLLARVVSACGALDPAAAQTSAVTSAAQAEQTTAAATQAGLSEAATVREGLTEAAAQATATASEVSPQTGQSPSAGVPSLEKLTIGIAQDFDSLDPNISVAAGTQEVMFNLFHGLINITPAGEIIPELAESYETGADLLTYAFRLRPGVTFHNGKALTSADVVYTYLRYLGKTADQTSPINSEIERLVGEVSAPDERTVLFTLKEPSAAFISLCMYPIIPEDSGPSQAENPVGTGPYAFVSYSPGIGIVLSRFEGYYGQKPQFSEVEFKIFTNANAGQLALQNGEIQIMNLAATTLAYDESRLKLVKQPQNMVQLLALNHAFTPFSDIRVRRALNHAIDKKEIIEVLSPGSPQIDTNLSPVMSFYYNQDLLDYYPFDTEKALALLAEAGYGAGSPLRFTVRVPVEYQFHIDTAQMIQQQLEQVGVIMDIETIEWNSWLGEVYEQRDHESTIIGLTGKADPGDILSRQTSDYYRNFGNYANVQFDQLLREASATGDSDKRARIYKDAQRVLAEDAAHVFLMDPGNNVLMDRNIEGYTTYPIPYIDLRLITYGENSNQ